MAEIKLVTLDGLKKFKDLLDNSYSTKFAEQGAGGSFATDEEVEQLLDDIFGNNSADGEEKEITFATDEEVENLLDDIFG